MEGRMELVLGATTERQRYGARLSEGWVVSPEEGDRRVRGYLVMPDTLLDMAERLILDVLGGEAAPAQGG